MPRLVLAIDPHDSLVETAEVARIVPVRHHAVGNRLSGWDWHQRRVRDFGILRGLVIVRVWRRVCSFSVQRGPRLSAPKAHL